MSFLPPTLNILLVLVGLILLLRYRKLGLLSILAGLVSLYLLSTPYVADRLLASVEVAPVIEKEPLRSIDNAVIVVLGSGHSELQTEYGGPWPDANGIARLNYAAKLHRLTEQPILLTGGQPEHSDYANAEVMADYLWQQLFIRAKWLETRSRTTEQNAEYSREILLQEGVDTVILVTQSVHMRRSILLFERAGFNVIPAPTGLAEGVRSGLSDWLPSTWALNKSQMSLHEILGYWWYHIIAKP